MTTSADTFPALSGFYRLLFLYLEPMSTLAPFLMVWVINGPSWFHHQLIPSTQPHPATIEDGRTLMAVWQLANCYLLLGMISSFVFRAIRDAVPNNGVAQERILGSAFLALGIADLTHIAASYYGLPLELRYAPLEWNSMTHGNITVVIVLFLCRVAWWAGIGRTRYYFGQPATKSAKYN